MTTKAVTRRNDLDWIRILLILSVFFYHCGRAFNGERWHINDIHTSTFLGNMLNFMEPWMMPAIFVVSAASIVYALNKGHTGKFVVDKVKRLLVPLVFGIFILSPHQIYLERLTHGEFNGSLLQFIPHYFDGLYTFGGNFAWMGVHLWYLLILFLYSLIFLPLFLLLKTKIGSGFVRGFAWLFSKPGLIYLLGLLLVIPLNLFDEDSFLGSTSTGGNSLSTYMFFFLLGFLIFSDDRLQKSAIRLRYFSLALAFAFTLLSFDEMAHHARYVLAEDLSLDDGINCLMAWSWILVILGFGMRYLTMDNAIKRYASEAVLPFYMLHQPIILIVGYFIIQLAVPVAVKYGLIVILSLTLILAIYEGLVRRFNVLRVLFGMKWIQREKREIHPAAQPAD